MKDSIARVELAIKELQQGRMIILTDDPDRENEGDLICPGETITSEMMSFIIRHSSGVVCVSLLPEKLKQLGLSLMVPPHSNTSARATPFTISIDAKEGTTTGVSAADRVKTILDAVADNASPTDLVVPGHVFPLQAREEGVFVRAGHTEGSMDIVKLAGFKPAAVLCEIMNPDGTMTRGDALQEFAKTHQLVMLAIEDILQYRLYHESIIEQPVSAELPLENYGQFTIHVFKEKFQDKEHIALVKNPVNIEKGVLTRIHSSCVTGDLFNSLRCDCNAQLHYSLEQIAKEGGILVYLNQEGRGIGLLNKIKAYALQETGLDTVEANQELGLPVDAREYAIAAHILRKLKVDSIRLLTNNPAKINDLKRYDFVSVTRENMPVFTNEHNHAYLETKREKMNHRILSLV